MVRIYKDCHFVCVFYRMTLLKLITDCWFNTLLVLLFVLEILKKKKLRKKISFFNFFIIDCSFSELFFLYSCPPDSKSEKKNFP